MTTQGAAPSGEGAAGATPPVVLVATDFSESSEAAVHWGLRVARAHRWRVLLVHSLPLHGPMTDFLPSPPELEEHLQGMAAEKLQEAASRLAAEGVEVGSRLAIGLPSQGVLEVAREVSPRLLVAGSRGHSDLTHLLLGSTAERLVQHAPCPVLTVHPADRHRHPHVRTVLIPTDFSHDAQSAAETARHLLSVVPNARLVLLHAFHLPLEYTAYGTIPTGLHFHEDVASRAEVQLEELAETLRGDGVTVETRAREGFPPEVILATAAEIGAELIAMGTHGRSGLSHLFLGSTAERVVQAAPCPVLTVRG